MRDAVLAVALLAGLCGCHDPVRDPVYTRCRAVATEGWQARIVETPQPRLVVSGRVSVPNDGYRVALERGPVQRLEPPVQQVILRTTLRRGGATQAVVTQEVEGAFELEEGVERVSVRCGDGILALIPSIERGAGD